MTQQAASSFCRDRRIDGTGSIDTDHPNGLPTTSHRRTTLVTTARERFLEALLESAVDLAIVATDAAGLVTEWNAGAERLFGWLAAEIRGGAIDRIFTPEDLAAGRPGEEMRRALDSGRAEDERWHVRADGSRFWASGGLTPLRQEDGVHVGFLKILRDRTASRQAEARRHESEAQFRATFEQAAVGVAHVGLDGRWLRVNARLCEMLGLSEAELLACRFQDVTHPDDVEPNLAHVRRVLAGEVTTYTMEKRYLGAGGRLVWAVLTAALVRDAAGAPGYFVSVIVDITPRRQAEAALHAGEARFRAVAEAMPGFVWTADDQGNLDYTSPPWHVYSGLDPAAGGGQAWVQSVHADDVDRAVARWSDAVASGSPYETEFRLRRSDGSYRWWLARARPSEGADGRRRWIGVCTEIDDIVTARDTLARSQAELERLVAERTQALRIAEARQRAVFDSTRQLIGLFDLQGNVLDANRAALDAVGATLSEVVGRPFWQTPWFCATPGIRELVEGGLTSIAAGGAIRTEVALNLPGGRARLFDFSMAPVRDEAGRVVEVVPEGTDVTEQRRVEEQLRQSQKMEAVGQLTGGLAHDFNNLLTGIGGSLELLQMRLAQGRTEGLERYVTAAQDGVARAGALTQRLLAFARREKLDPRPTDAGELVAGMEELVRHTVGPAVEIEVVREEGLPTILADPSQLENALLNLCINARDAMPAGGRLTIRTAGAWLDEPDLAPGRYVLVSVTDTGVGMTPEVAARAFDPFFTTKPSGMGTGLGLAMVYGFARQSGGQVRVTSEVGRGTEVTLCLPEEKALLF